MASHVCSVRVNIQAEISHRITKSIIPFLMQNKIFFRNLDIANENRLFWLTIETTFGLYV
jgi:hypothetical protein